MMEAWPLPWRQHLPSKCHSSPPYDRFPPSVILGIADLTAALPVPSSPRTAIALDLLYLLLAPLNLRYQAVLSAAVLTAASVRG